MKLKTTYLGILVFLFALGTQLAWSQGRISGNATGKVTLNGQPVKDATVVYTNLQTQREYKTKSDKKGEYTIVGVMYGDYQVEITDRAGNNYKQRTSITGNEDNDRVDAVLGGQAKTIVPGAESSSAAAASNPSTSGKRSRHVAGWKCLVRRFRVRRLIRVTRISSICGSSA